MTLIVEFDNHLIQIWKIHSSTSGDLHKIQVDLEFYLRMFGQERSSYGKSDYDLGV